MLRRLTGPLAALFLNPAPTTTPQVGAEATVATPAAETSDAPVATGRDRANPVPVGTEVAAGPLRLQVLESVRGQAAVDAVLAAAPQNEQPRDGVDYVLVRVAAENDSDLLVPVNGNDFGLTGSSGVVRRFLGAAPPNPALDAILDPGERAEGWLVFAAPVDETNLMLLFDSLSIPGTWADRLLAVDDGARIAPLASRVAPVDEVGRDVAAPAGLNTPVTTDQWQVELLDVRVGEDVFNLTDYRTGALGVEDATGADGSVWVAVLVRVTNARDGGDLAYFPPTAFRLADETGAPITDLGSLTPPRPDAAGWYYPGATREGWIAFDIPTDVASTLVRFLPEPDTNPAPDPRYLTFGS